MGAGSESLAQLYRFRETRRKAVGTSLTAVGFELPEKQSHSCESGELSHFRRLAERQETAHSDLRGSPGNLVTLQTAR